MRLVKEATIPPPPPSAIGEQFSRAKGEEEVQESKKEKLENKEEQEFDCDKHVNELQVKVKDSSM